MILFLAALGGMILYNAFSWGVVTWCFYNWFIQDFFHLPEASMYQGIGMAMFIMIFKATIKSPNKDDESIPLWLHLIHPWFVWLSGGLVYWLLL